MKKTGRTGRSVFHRSVRGLSHIKKNTICQDASGEYQSEDGHQRIVVVADGHGDRSCIRSDKGSATAVSKAIDCLTQFGCAYPEYADIQRSYMGRYGIEQAVEQLTNAIICYWSEDVLNDLKKHPLTDAEKESAGDMAVLYDKGRHLDRIYGTTLVAALETEDYILMLQQGDGRCDLLLEDGEIIQPILEDERCHANVTTSLSDDDASKRIRGCLYRAGKNKDVAACLVGTDGIDNGFFSDEELYEFYLKVFLKLAECDNGNDADAQLGQLLYDVSTNGNGDDVSLAGLVSFDTVIESIKAALNKAIRTEDNE